ncbi:MAG: FmdB family zinc ribbon protein [Thermodesulfobacteriota bacterium]
MPIYEYVCANCAKEFEELILGAQEDVACPECESRETRRMLSRCKSRIGGHAGAELGAEAPASGGGCASCSSGSCASCG